MTYWSQALVASRAASDQLFPFLLGLAEEPQTIGFLQSLAESLPSWWEFFSDTRQDRRGIRKRSERFTPFAALKRALR